MFSNTSPKGEAVLNLSCSTVRCHPMKPVLAMQWPIRDGQGTAAVSSLARPPQGHSGPFALPRLQTSCEQPDGEKIIFILGLGEESGWAGSFFLWGEKGSAWRHSVLLGGLLISDGSTLRAREPGGSRHPRGTAAQLSTAGLFQGSAVYDWAFLVSIINKHINVITAGVEIKLGLRL